MKSIYDLVEDLSEYPEFNEYFSGGFNCECYSNIPISLLQERFGLDKETLLCMKEDDHVWISVSNETVSIGLSG